MDPQEFGERRLMRRGEAGILMAGLLVMMAVMAFLMSAMTAYRTLPSGHGGSRYDGKATGTWRRSEYPRWRRRRDE